MTLKRIDVVAPQGDDLIKVRRNGTCRIWRLNVTDSLIALSHAHYAQGELFSAEALYNLLLAQKDTHTHIDGFEEVTLASVARTFNRYVHAHRHEFVYFPGDRYAWKPQEQEAAQ